MDNLELFISPKRTYDALITKKIPLAALNELFGFNLHNHKPMLKNIANDTIQLYTFYDGLQPSLSINVAELKVKATNRTIATDFLQHMSVSKFKTEHYDRVIHNHELIRTYINEECLAKMKKDLRSLKKNASVTSLDNSTLNASCCKLIKILIEHCRDRFDKNSKIQPLPFRIGDSFIFYYTVCAGNIKRTYQIQLFVC